MSLSGLHELLAENQHLREQLALAVKCVERALERPIYLAPVVDPAPAYQHQGEFLPYRLFHDDAYNAAIHSALRMHILNTGS